MVYERLWKQKVTEFTPGFTTNQPCDLEEDTELHCASGSSSVKWVYINRPCLSRLIENQIGS